MNKFIALFVGILTFFLLIVVSPARIKGDFDVYYQASRNFLAKAPVYTAHGGIEEFKYFPAFALAFSPLAMMNEHRALYLWSIFNIGFFYAIFYLFHMMGLLNFRSLKGAAVIVLMFGLCGRYIFDDVKLGQVNMLLCFLMVLTIYLDIKKKEVAAGGILALSLMVKFFPLMILSYFVITRRYKAIASCAVFVVILLCVPALYTGWDLNLRYLHEWHELLKSSPAVLFYSVRNNSFLSFYSWIFIARHEHLNIRDYDQITKALTPMVYQCWLVTSALFYLAFYGDCFWRKAEDRTLKMLDYACLFVCGLLFNPLSYLNALVLMVVPYFVIVVYLWESQLKDSNSRLAAGILLLSLLFMALDNGFFYRHADEYSILQLKPLMWSMIMVYLALLLLKFNKTKSFNLSPVDGHE